MNKDQGRKQKIWYILFTNKKLLLFIVFILAFGLRLIYLIQISHAPYFEDPAGDSKFFLDRAQEIIKGDFWGNEIYFRSSPFYPYFLAFFFWLFGNNFLALGLVQILIGSANCLLIFILAERLSGKKTTAFIAGISAAMYGVFAFFDADLLMIFLTVVFVDTALLLLIKYKETKRRTLVFIAGLCLGIAILDRTNLLLFIPVAALFVAGAYSLKWKQWKIKPALIFIGGTLLAILPLTLRNYLAGRDFVLVSSNFGVNLFIGNNPQAMGAFYLPPESGLSNEDLDGSSIRVAEAETKHRLKPSEVSNYWAQRACKFIFTEPIKELSILYRKFLLLWNAYEIPNNLDFYFIKMKFAPVLNILFVGFWLIAPLALVGITRCRQRKLSYNAKLLISFLITYMLSLIPFFITERYRLPMVPILIVFASIALTDIFSLIKAGAIKNLIPLVLVLILSTIFINWHRIQFPYNRQRIIVSSRYLKRALENPRTYYQDFKKAILELKWIIETEPFNSTAHYQLGKAYASIGYYSGAINEWEITLRLDPKSTSVATGLEQLREKFNKLGDIVTKQSIPQALFEEALSWEGKKNYRKAKELYEVIVHQDPFHFQAWNSLALLSFRQGQYHAAEKIFKKGLRILPNNLILLYDLAKTYNRLEEIEKANTTWWQYKKAESQTRTIFEQLALIKTSVLIDTL